MQEIKCPNCGELFPIDASKYEQIVQQVRTMEFNTELRDREKAIGEQKDREWENKYEKLRYEKDGEIKDLEAQLSSSETDKRLAVSEAERKKDEQLQKALLEKETALLEKTLEIEALNGKLSSTATDQKLAVSEAVREKENEIAKLKTEIFEKQQQFDLTLKAKDETIEQYRDFKSRLSTKMIGESLEQHCLDQFNTFRAVAFPNAYFEKDNDARGGSKGDFIFREASQSGIEFISIMFEMKNEADTTATKHKNEDFFQKLDKDRREKGCEYAVLVSMLEPDSELYNNGIVDVSHRYEKMYVIRPQFFIPILSLLRNAARNTLAIRQELLEAKHQQVDIENFQSNLNDFKGKFSRNFKLASQKFNTAIEEIDKAIARLSKVKEELLSSENQLRLANDKAEDLSIKKLAKNAPSLLEACAAQESVSPGKRRSGGAKAQRETLADAADNVPTTVCAPSSAAVAPAEPSESSGSTADAEAAIGSSVV